MDDNTPPAERATAHERAALQHLQAGLVDLDKAIEAAASEQEKGDLIARRFQIERRLTDPFLWSSQAGQDRWLAETLFKNLTGGVFVEVGAYDGLTGSNTLFFERYKGWSGLLVEPSPHWAAVARSHRKATCIECAVGGRPGSATFMEVTKGYTQMGGLTGSYDPGLKSRVESDPRFEGRELSVAVRLLADILAEHGLRAIDYLSLDIEGAEVEVLTSFPFTDFDIKAWSIENNTNTGAISKVMSEAGYAFAGRIGVDEMWVHGKYVTPS
ncbi:MAG: FkbM family methyltransferase [Roseibium sp.]|nr:FkbM family methyltransferase [Roseibium sp.]